MRDKKWFPVLYMFVLTAFFSSIVIAMSVLTRERIEANKTLRFEKAILEVIPGLYDPSIDDLDLHRRFKEKIQPPDESSAEAYIYKSQGVISGYALPVSGPGFWAPIKGVVGIKADKKTLTGITFYDQNETPGLGAEITQKEFRNQFKGKVISMTGKCINFKRPAEDLDNSDVHAITGATQTSTRLESFLNEDLNQWRKKMIEGEKEK